MALKEILNQIFSDSALDITVVGCQDDVCSVEADRQSQEINLEKLIELSNRLFAEKYSSGNHPQAKLFTETAPQIYAVDSDLAHAGPENILLKKNNEWILIGTDSVTQLADQASFTCRRPMSVGVTVGATTFLNWSGPDMRPQVAECDNATMSCETKDLGAINKPRGFYDFHDYTHLVRAGDGHLLVFYSYHNGDLWQLRSPQSDSIDGEWQKTELGGVGGESARATYPMPVVTQDGTVYLFFRKTTDVIDDKPIQYVKSTDNGQTWTEPQSAINYLNSRPDHLNEIYVGRMTLEPATSKHKERILMSWTLAGGGNQRHAHDIYHKDLYFAYFYPNTQRFTSVTGVDLGSSIENEEARLHCKVFDSGDLSQEEKKHIDYFPMTQFNPLTGTPLIIFFNQITQKTMLTKWQDGTWKQHELEFGVKEFSVTANGKLRAFSPRQTAVWVYESADGGNSWEVVEKISTPTKMDRVVSVNGSDNLLLGQHTTKTDFSTNETTGNSEVVLIRTGENED